MRLFCSVSLAFFICFVAYQLHGSRGKMPDDNFVFTDSCKTSLGQRSQNNLLFLPVTCCHDTRLLMFLLLLEVVSKFLKHLVLQPTKVLTLCWMCLIFWLHSLFVRCTLLQKSFVLQVVLLEKMILVCNAHHSSTVRDRI